MRGMAVAKNLSMRCKREWVKCTEVDTEKS